MGKSKKETSDTTIKGIRNLFRLKKGNKEIKDRILRDIRNLFKLEKENKIIKDITSLSEREEEENC